MSDNPDGSTGPEDLPEDDGVLEPADSLETDDLDADPLDAGIVPPDQWSVAESYGVTAEEARRGEPLDRRLSEEEPEPGAGQPVDDRWEDGPTPRTGRLLAGDEGAHGVRDPETLAYDVGINGGAASAEEAAVHAEEPEEYEGPEEFEEVLRYDLPELPGTPGGGREAGEAGGGAGKTNEEAEESEDSE